MLPHLSSPAVPAACHPHSPDPFPGVPGALFLCGLLDHDVIANITDITLTVASLEFTKLSSEVYVYTQTSLESFVNF